MPVLSRKIGECILIGDQVLTLLRIADAYVEISLAKTTGEDYRTAKLWQQRPVQLLSNVQVGLVSTDGLRARLGINAPPQFGIARNEFGP